MSVKPAVPLLAALALAGGLAAAEPAPAPVAAAFKPGVTTEYVVKLPASLQELAAGGAGRKAPATRALCAVALPAGFDPVRPWPVLVVSATTSGRGAVSSRRALARFSGPALAAGWVVVAADPDQPVTLEQDTNGLRYALIKAALAGLNLEWPDFPRWPVAFGGFSGGAKRSAWMAALYVLDGQRPVGVFQGGCNEPTMALALENYRPDPRTFQAIPVFLSSGDQDPVATPEQQHDSCRELQQAGFKRVRLETYLGAHELNAAQVTAALQWFRP